MSPSFPILESVRALFPKSANRTIMVANAWNPADSKLERPEPNGWEDGWTHVGKPATRDVVQDLKDKGFTVVNLEASGVANRHKDVPISALL
ncbi:hypothetical protein [Pseudarthrobacter sp. BIM B-2242]|uniref:hypothetical protein n=1 Tax=Pseudarthrobacter sp. BIM B-2242 TaxID=2772401 RepID=UPI00168A4044|nr:hypothetical protein [Pseudarthrobacter sp. BIM B-2242]QOD05923.1 hypothetical protein IDT60_20345 [Pseudarthrobacter sp. BIM B-2242]